jgi:hypothetical protein
LEERVDEHVGELAAGPVVECAGDEVDVGDVDRGEVVEPEVADRVRGSSP